KKTAAIQRPAKSSAAVTTYWSAPITDQTTLVGGRASATRVATAASMAPVIRAFRACASTSVAIAQRVSGGTRCSRSPITFPVGDPIAELVRVAVARRARHRNVDVLDALRAKARDEVRPQPLGFGPDAVGLVQYDELPRKSRRPAT